MAEPQATHLFSHPPIGYNDHAQTQTRGVRGLTVDCGSNNGYCITGYGVDTIEDDSSQVGGGAAAGLPAGGVQAQALSTMAIGKKVEKRFVPYHHPQKNAHPR